MDIEGKPPLYDSFLKRAAEEIGADSLLASVESAREKASRNKSLLDDALEAVNSFIRLLVAWKRGKYTGISTGNVVIIAAAILYFLAPVDAVPDFLPFFGFMDDVAFILHVAAKLREELARFNMWEKASGKAGGPGAGGADKNP